MNDWELTVTVVSDSVNCRYSTGGEFPEITGYTTDAYHYCTIVVL